MRSKRHVVLIPLLVIAAVGCAARGGPQLVLPGTPALGAADLIARYPLAPNQPIRVERLGAMASVSYHLVQIQVGGGERRHRHEHHDLVALVLRGEGTQWVDSRPIRLRAGDAAMIPAGTPHYFVNTGDAPAAALIIFSPPFDGSDQVFLDP